MLISKIQLNIMVPQEAVTSVSGHFRPRTLQTQDTLDSGPKCPETVWMQVQRVYFSKLIHV